jgi:hypothetical protein
VICSTASGIVQLTAVIVADRWFELTPQRAFILALIVSGEDLSSSLFNLIVTEFVNPTNVRFDKQIGFVLEDKVIQNVPSSFLKLGGILVAMQIICLIFLRNPETKTEIESQTETEAEADTNSLKIITDVIIRKQQKQMKFDNVRQSRLNKNDEKEPLTSLISISSSNKTTNNSKDSNISISIAIPISTSARLSQVLKTPLFWNLVLTAWCIPATFVDSQWKEFNSSYLGIENDRLLVYMITAASIGKVIACLFWGCVYDYFLNRNRRKQKK